MNCEECRQAISEYVLDFLAKAEARLIEEHLASCSACQAEMEEVTAELALLPGLLEPSSPSPSVKAKLLNKIKITEPVSPTPSYTHPAESGVSVSVYEQWKSAFSFLFPYAVGFAMCFMAGFTVLRVFQLQQQPTTKAPATQHHLVKASEAKFPTSFRFASASLSDSKYLTSAVFIWDKVASEWHLFAFDLQTGVKEFQLWLIDPDGKRIHLGTMTSEGDGFGSALIKAPARFPQNSSVAITSGSMNRDEKMVLLAKAKLSHS